MALLLFPQHSRLLQAQHIGCATWVQVKSLDVSLAAFRILLVHGTPFSGTRDEVKDAWVKWQSDKIWEVRQLRQLVQQRRAVRLHQVYRPAEFDLPPLWHYCSPVVTFAKCPEMKWRFPNWARHCGIPLWTGCKMYSDKVLIGIDCALKMFRSDINCVKLYVVFLQKCLLHIQLEQETAT